MIGRPPCRGWVSPRILGRTVRTVMQDDAQYAETAEQLRQVLAALADPADELRASAATCHRIEGAVAALVALSVPAS